MRILVIGDIVGKPGRRAVAELLPRLREEHLPDFVIANAENAAGGAGITQETAKPLYDAGVDVLTMGNHVWNQKDSFSYIEREDRLIRPANFPPGVPGRGFGIYLCGDMRIGVVNLQGRTFMQPIDDPFRSADSILEELRGSADIIIIDFHAEATSEKMALAWHLDGRVACVYGTHTHVQTADERVLREGTAFISDVGMTGPKDSIIGMRPEEIIQRFITGLPAKFEVASGSVVLNGIVVDTDDSAGLASGIFRVHCETR